jgi:hypothetical protein
MVPLLAEQSVDHKITNHLSILIGNYEYYYAAGLISQKIDIDPDIISAPEKLDNVIKKGLADFHPEDENTEYLCTLLKKYEMKSAEFDDDMKELFRLGKESGILNEDV